MPARIVCHTAKGPCDSRTSLEITVLRVASEQMRTSPSRLLPTARPMLGPLWRRRSVRREPQPTPLAWPTRVSPVCLTPTRPPRVPPLASSTAPRRVRWPWSSTLPPRVRWVPRRAAVVARSRVGVLRLARAAVRSFPHPFAARCCRFARQTCRGPGSRTLLGLRAMACARRSRCRRRLRRCG